MRPRLLTGTKKFDHITPVLRELHWLQVSSRIQYKILLLTYKVLRGLAPVYLSDMLTYSTARPGLRSTGVLLRTPRTRLVSYGDRAFSSVAPRLWNSLPSDLRLTTDVHVFKTSLKTLLFNTAY